MGEVAKLGTLAERINAEHRACAVAALDALEHAMAAGELLMQAKDACPHGTWLAWLEDNFVGSVRTAQVYMRLSRDRLMLEAAKAQGAAYLSIAGAMQALAEPPKGVPPIPDRNVPFDHPTPPDQEAEERITDADYVLRTVTWALGGAVAPELELRPEEAVEALRRMPRKDRNRRTEALREGMAWLERVLEEAEAASEAGREGQREQPP